MFSSLLTCSNSFYYVLVFKLFPVGKGAGPLDDVFPFLNIRIWNKRRVRTMDHFHLQLVLYLFHAGHSVLPFANTVEYIYIYICVCVCVCVCIFRDIRESRMQAGRQLSIFSGYTWGLEGNTKHIMSWCT